MDTGKTGLLLAAAVLAGGCAGTPELEGAAAARSRGAGVDAPREAAAAPEGAPAAPSKPVDPWLDDETILARVNGHLITLRQVRHRMPQYDQFLEDRAGLARYVNAQVREMVLQRLLIDEGKRIGLSVNDEDMEYQEEMLAKRARAAGTTVEQTIRDMSMSRSEWDQEQRDRILSMRAQYYMVGAAPDAAYSEERFRPSVDPYVGPSEVRAWGERHRATLEKPESAVLRILWVPLEAAAVEGAPEDEAWRKCGEAVDALEARLAAGEPFAKVADSSRRYPGADEGGLKGPVFRDSPFPQQFKDWAFAPERRPGDRSERLRRGPGYVVLHLESRTEASRPDIEEWGAAARARLEGLRRQLAWLEVQVRLLEEGTVSPAELRSTLLAEVRADARRVRAEIEPPANGRTASAPVR
jgi:hypothetical protein